MHHEIRGSRLEVIANAGHVSNLEKPEQFNEVLLDFLKGL
jgi:pimeloyl-ACP methyl ester carboxylesterase